MDKRRTIYKVISSSAGGMGKMGLKNVIQGDYQNYVSRKGDFLFIDPPYLGTSGNYNENSLNMKDFLKWEEKLTVPHIITYSEPIDEIDSDWICWLTKKVPNIRQGGSKVRKDYYTYIIP